MIKNKKKKKELNQFYYHDTRGLLKEIFHMLAIVLFDIIVGVICWFIWLITYEKAERGDITLRKARRIRLLTNFKLWYYRHFKFLTRFFRDEDYFIGIHKRFGDSV